MDINFKHFKKIESDENTTTLMHPKGHKVVVAHKALSKKLREQLSALESHIPKKMANGGMVQPASKNKKEYKDDPNHDQHARHSVPVIPPEGATIETLADGGEVGMAQKFGHHIGSSITEGVKDGLQAVKDVLSPVGNAVQGFVQGASAQPLAEIPSVSSVEGATAMDPNATPPTTGGSLDPNQPTAAPNGLAASGQPTDPAATTSAGLSPMPAGMPGQAGVEQEYKAKALASKEGERALANHNAQIEKSIQQHDADMKGLNDRRAALTQQIADSKIDPERYWNSKSTGGKISTVLGLILGGMNTTGNNIVANALDKAVEHDIEAQRGEIGKKQNLLSAINEDFKNSEQANQYHRVLLNDLVVHKIEQAAAKANNPIAMAQLQQLKDKYAADSAMKMKELEINKVLSNPMAPADFGVQALNQLEMINPEKAKSYRERYVPGAGLALTSSGAIKLRETKANADDSIIGINDLRKFIGKGSQLSPAARSEAATTAKLLVGKLNRPITGGGPMSENEQKLINSIIANPTNIFSLDATSKAALDTLEKRVRDGLNSEIKIYTGTAAPSRPVHSAPVLPGKK